MSSTLRLVVDRLRRDALATPRRVFEEARGRQPWLSAHADVASVFVALADSRESTYPVRDDLTRALLSEHRTSGLDGAGRVLPDAQSSTAPPR